MRFDGNEGDAPNYYPNSFGGPEPDVNAAEPPFEVSGITARQPYKHPNRDFSQPGELYHKVMTDVDREHLIGNMLATLKMRIKTSSCGRQESSTKQTKNTGNA